ncbi:ComF family protein [Wenxinia saemankumensis]|uniref:double zinc ribbon domain-containing protein n=1 Tax=Wenxinia saemankumensis TaxID=1447782 RepID=UPI00093496E1
MRRVAGAASRLLYPAQCVACGSFTEAAHHLCGPCWRDCRFIGGTICDGCGTPLPGEAVLARELCDDCRAADFPWSRGRAAMVYRDTARRLVLQLKHSDRTDLARAGGLWMSRAGRDLIGADTLLVPVPLHWSRLWRRRYNQAALLAQWLGVESGAEVAVDALVRPRRTISAAGRAARFAALEGAIRPHPRRGAAMAGRPVVIVDDVMTSGATLTTAALAATGAGAASVDVLTLARAVRGA